MPENENTLELKGKVSSNWVYSSFTVFFTLLFAGIILLTVFANTNTFFSHTWYWLLLAAISGFAAVGLLYFLLNLFKAPKHGIEVLIVLFVFALFVTAQVFVGLRLQVVPTNDWDYGLTFSNAQNYVMRGTLPGDYFMLFPNNTALYTILCGFFSVLAEFGIFNFLLPSMILNIICIDVSVLLLYLCVRRLFGSQRALFMLVCSLFVLPFILYVPILYTDTMSMPFPIGAVLLWLTARSRFLEGKRTQGIVYFCLMSAFIALGGVIKVTVMILWIAAVIDLLFYLRAKGKLIGLMLGTLVAAGVLVGGMWLSRNSAILPKYDYDKGIPAEHWVMMGLSGNGGYNDEDNQLTLSQPDKASRAKLNRAEIGNRLQKMGFIGAVQHLGTKLSYTFGEGTLSATDKLGINPVSINEMHDYVIYTNHGFSYIAHISFGIWAALLICIVISGIKSFIRKNYSLTFVRVAILGLILFLLLWETNSRYLMNFLPLFLLAAIEAAPMPIPLVQRKGARAQMITNRHTSKEASKQPIGQIPSVRADDLVLPENENISLGLFDQANDD